ncbi:hypothetical protein [Maribacter sp. Asnod1-A12]|uniref:hypothetical protein n=1 Tax=Maribacter sp. Asnod1-A12 TaxID=3160576 RepID=UPI003868716F
MKKNFLQFILFICLLLSSIGGTLFANYNIEGSSFYTTNQVSKFFSSNQNFGDHNHKAVLKNVFGNDVKSLEFDAVEIEEEEESKHYSLSSSVDQNYPSAAFYLLSLLFLFSYLENSNTLSKLFKSFSTVDRRFVLYQVFRI